MAKRNRKMDWIKIINNPFPENIQIHWHHINDKYVFPIPAEIHYSMLGKKHREKINNWIEQKMDINLNKLMGGM